MSRYARVLIPGGLVALVWLVYGPSLAFEFVGIDDPGYVTENEQVLSGLASWSWAFTSTAQGNWHPLTWLSLMLDAQLGGGSPKAFHLTNVLLHLVNTLLLWEVFRRLTGAVWESGFVAALFAVHPLHVESVAWIAERKDVLSTLFWILTMLAYARYAERPGAGRYLWVVASMGLGLMAKPMLVSLPAVLLLLDYWPLNRLVPTRQGLRAALTAPRGALFDKIPLVLMAIASSVVTIYTQEKGGAIRTLELIPLGARAGNALLSYVRYMFKAIWPFDLAAHYPYDFTVLTSWRIGAAALALAVVTAVVILAGRRRPYLAVGWLWYVITLVPVIGLVQVGSQSMADRYTYVPLIGVFVMVLWGIGELVRNRALRVRISVGVGGAAVVIALAGVAHVQAAHWRNTVSLFTHALGVTRDNSLAHNALGLDLYRRGRVDDAVEHYDRAIATAPRYFEARVNLAAALMRSGRLDEAVEQYREALRLRPGDPMIEMNLGVALMGRGRLDEAETLVRGVLQRQSENAAARSALGVILARRGQHDQAVVELRRALELDPGNVETRVNLGTALMRLGRWDEAEIELGEAVRLGPDSAPAHRNLGVVLARRGELATAADHLTEALRIDPGDAGAQNNLERVRRLLATARE